MSQVQSWNSIQKPPKYQSDIAFSFLEKGKVKTFSIFMHEKCFYFLKARSLRGFGGETWRKETTWKTQVQMGG